MPADLDRARYVAGRYRDLQGLRVVPWSVVFGLWALGESGLHLGPWWLWALGISIVSAVGLTVVLGPYYRRAFGSVDPRPEGWRRWGVVAAAGAAVVVTGAVDTAWRMQPVSLTGLALAALIAAVYWRWRRHARHHLAFAAVLAAVSLAPLGAVAPVDGLHPLSSATGTSVAVAGFFLVGGLGDHLLLVRTLRRGTETW